MDGAWRIWMERGGYGWSVRICEDISHNVERGLPTTPPFPINRSEDNSYFTTDVTMSLVATAKW
eukprot:179287-Chlamydomonas_euryale.AAC.4